MNSSLQGSKSAVPKYMSELVQKCSKCVVKNFSMFNIVFYEFTATTFFTYIVFIYGGTTTAPGVFVTVFGMFVCFLWIARFTGTFMNPAVVIGCMIKK